MPSNLSRGLLIFALLVVAVLSWQWIDDRSIEPRLESETIDMAETQSDYYLEDFEILNISNKVGSTSDARNNESPEPSANRQLKLTGQSLLHHHIEGYSVIKDPRVQIRSTDNAQWHAEASSGTVSANFDVLDLLGNVELTHNSAEGRSPVRVDTNSISIDTGNRTISSNESVQVKGGGWHYNANSMSAEIDQGTLSFTSGVEAQFASPK